MNANIETSTMKALIESKIVEELILHEANQNQLQSSIFYRNICKRYIWQYDTALFSTEVDTRLGKFQVLFFFSMSEKNQDISLTVNFMFMVILSGIRSPKINLHSNVKRNCSDGQIIIHHLIHANSSTRD